MKMKNYATYLTNFFILKRLFFIKR
jgi:hypothetical protein